MYGQVQHWHDMVNQLYFNNNNKKKEMVIV